VYYSGAAQKIQCHRASQLKNPVDYASRAPWQKVNEKGDLHMYLQLLREYHACEDSYHKNTLGHLIRTEDRAAEELSQEHIDYGQKHHSDQGETAYRAKNIRGAVKDLCYLTHLIPSR